ncbi:MAG: polysaccharide biosynthesis/export family protein [Deltaproteobacteria bacterium]|nr:polysaccharide biosynthesis/export family protein [Deltaproteobacteria bacterium]
MASRTRRLLSVHTMIASFFFIQACTIEAPGISVKTYREPAVVTDAAEKEQREMTQAIQQMTQVKENSVFTEKTGVPEYIVGQGDVISILYWTPSREEGFKQNIYTTTVRPDGKISFIFADDIPVTGRTAREIDDILTGLAQRYMRDPRIEVIVKEFKSKSCLLFGQINILQQGTSGPGKYPLLGKTRALDLIVAAGGVISGQETGNADLRQVELVRQGKRYTLNLYNAMFRGDVSDNVVLESGDTITVPEMPTFAERVYIFGQVASQGIRKLKDSQDLLTAIAISGGTTPVAVKTDIKIIREYKERNGKPLILSANLDQILLQGDLSQNIRLKDGDVVYVPRSVIGDINEFIENITPSLDFLMDRPSNFRSNYMMNQDAMKLRW